MSWRASSLEKMVMLGKIEGRRRRGDRAIDGIIDSVDMNEWVKVAQSFPTLTPWTIQSMEFSRSEYWSGWPFPSPGDLSNPGMKPRFPALQVDSLPAEPQGKPQWTWVWANSGRRGRTGKPGDLQSLESQRVRHDWMTEQQQKFYMSSISQF